MRGSPAARTSRGPIAPGERASWQSPPRVSPNRAPDHGIFFTHISSPRISRHFRRLVEETDSLVDWRFVFNPEQGSRSATQIGRPPALGGRSRQMERHGGHLQGFLDVAWIPRVLAMEARRVWVMEYDVDYAGCWADFFAQFADNDCDVLTSSLAHQTETPDWVHWNTASAPPWVQERHFHRCFHPLMRLSRRFALTYGLMVADASWEGHSEFTLATAAAVSNATVEDFGGDGPFTPQGRRGRNYVNDPSDRDLTPGTFIWRPARSHYFHELPEAFPQPNKLYHPIKPWEHEGCV